MGWFVRRDRYGTVGSVQHDGFCTVNKEWWVRDVRWVRLVGAHETYGKSRSRSATFAMVVFDGKYKIVLEHFSLALTFFEIFTFVNS